MIKTILKIILLSIFYALPLFLFVELQLNIYRLEKITSLSNGLIILFSFFIFLFCIVFLFYVSKAIINSKLFYVALFLWFIPFYLLFRGFPLIFPFNHIDIPTPIVGIVMLIEIVFYQIFLLVIMILGQKKNVRPNV